MHQPERGKSEWDNMLYRHVKQMVCDLTSYVLCTRVSGNCTYVSNISVTHSAAGLTPEKKGKSSDFKVKFMENTL